MASAAYCRAAAFFFCLFCQKEKQQRASTQAAADSRMTWEWRWEGMMKA